MSALSRLTVEARIALGLELDGAGDPSCATAPIVVDTLAGHVDVLARFGIVNGPAREWRIAVRPALGPWSWVARWDHLTLYVGERSTIDLAAAVLRERALARRHLRAAVLELVNATGLPSYGYAKRLAVPS